MMGYTLEEVRGKNCRFLQRSERDQPALPLIREALRANREIVAVLRNYRRDGTGFWNELFLSPIRDLSGVVTHFVGIQNDISARVAFEEALRESEKLAAAGRLAASIAHEINNPLEAVTNMLYLARRRCNNEESERYLETAAKALQRVSLLTAQSLRFYKQSTRPQAVRPKDLISSVLDVYNAKLLNNDIAVERRDRTDEPIVCLESEIRQVLSNLVQNAIDAMRGPNRRLVIRTRETTDWRSAAKGVMIAVADTGTGMTAETIKKSIERSTQRRRSEEWVSDYGGAAGLSNGIRE
jgi:two-component system, sporulation sensor kinase C